MRVEEGFGMLMFFCVFEILGGAALGVALRGLWQRDFSGMFFLIWGAGFAGIPLLIGAAAFLGEGQPAYFFAQLFVLLATILTVALVPRDLFQGNVQGEDRVYVSGIIGAGMAMVGSAVFLFTFREGIGVPVLLGGLLALIGAFILLRAVVTALRSL